jgi:hypothetical protein
MPIFFLAEVVVELSLNKVAKHETHGSIWRQKLAADLS